MGDISAYIVSPAAVNEGAPILHADVLHTKDRLPRDESRDIIALRADSGLICIQK
jgi:hypothetical protein